MPYVQTQAKAVILQKALAKTVYVAVGHIFEQQRNMTVFFPVVRKTSQQAALHERRSLWRVQHCVTRIEKGGLYQYLTGQGGSRAGRMGGGGGLLRPGQVYRQMREGAAVDDGDAAGGEESGDE